MSIFKRAFLYVMRKRGKAVLLFVILLIMATFVLTGLSIWKASEAAQLDLRQSLVGLSLRPAFVRVFFTRCSRILSHSPLGAV